MEDLNEIDLESRKGRFGWTLIHELNIPYIFRPDGKYCSLRILDCVVFKNIPLFMRKEILSCTTSQSVSATGVELKLLHSINAHHCNSQFGTQRFDKTELLFKMSQAIEVCDFVRSCYNKLQKDSEIDFSSRCGFIKVDKESLLPYCVKNNEKYVPVFYLEGDVNSIKKNIIKMEGWELCYLKFCCKIQGVNNDIFASKSCSVVSLETLKGYFAKNTVLEEFWPPKNTKSLNKISTLNDLFCLSKISSDKKQNDFKNRDIENPPNKFSFAIQRNVTTKTTVSTPYSHKRNAFYVGPYYKCPNYALQRINIENRLINCVINTSDINDKWVTVEDLCREYFLNIPVLMCQKVLVILKIHVRKANLLQNVILQNTGLYRKNCVLTLVEAEKIIKNWFHIKTVLINYFKIPLILEPKV